MARIAYVDHSFHRTTRSNEFLPEVLRRHGHVVDNFWDEAWSGGAPVDWRQVAHYDVVMMFQSFCRPEAPYFRLGHPNVVYIPMLDQFGLWMGPMSNLAAFFEVFQGSKVLSFSNALHCLVTGLGISSHFARYYPAGAALPGIADMPAQRQDGLHGFFWLRRELQLPWRLVRRLIENTRFESFHLHLATDPGTPPPELPSAEDIARFNITTSTWFEDKADFDAVLARANVYFAPRPGEGIGQSFLEAMIRGQCVVAPDQGTMNEYILPGVNGLLYDLDHPRPLDFSSAIRMGTQARLGALAGRTRWEQAEDELVRFILTPSADLYAGRYQHPLSVSSRTISQSASVATGLKAFAQRNMLLKGTRFLWHPVLRLARQVRGR
ncbi:conserved hypothetical protein [Burkholderiales bacterium 8X]|nr:conserved hypothetical protein [Burkholderiales bacterium 8X]